MFVLKFRENFNFSQLFYFLFYKEVDFFYTQTLGNKYFQISKQYS